MVESRVWGVELKTLTQEQVDFLVAQGYFDPELIIREGAIFDDYKIWAFSETDKSAVMPTPIPDAITHAVCLLVDYSHH